MKVVFPALLQHHCCQRTELLNSAEQQSSGYAEFLGFSGGVAEENDYLMIASGPELAFDEIEGFDVGILEINPIANQK